MDIEPTLGRLKPRRIFNFHAICNAYIKNMFLVEYSKATNVIINMIRKIMVIDSISA